MVNLTPQTIIQKIIFLATGSPKSSSLLNEITSIYNETKDFSRIAELVDEFMSQRVVNENKAINTVVQQFVQNGFALSLSDQEVQQVVANLAAQGINTWSKLFKFAITGVNEDLSAILTNRVAAAHQNDFEVIQKYTILATGTPSSSALREELHKQYAQTNDLTHISALVDTYMSELTRMAGNDIDSVIQIVASNGFGLNLSAQETQQLVTDLMAQGVNSWSKLFAHATIKVNEDLSAILDNRSNAANHFTDLLAEKNEDSEYYGAQAANAAREWIAGIGAADASFEAASKTGQDLFNSLTHDNSVYDKVFDGYIAGATVFIDENEDNIHNPDEISTITDEFGNFLFDSVLPNGKLISIGGTDIATGQPFTGTLSAPHGAFTLSPLSTLVNQLLQNDQAENIVAAEDILFQSLNIPRIDLSFFDPIKTALDLNSTAQEQTIALKLQAVTVQISNLLLMSSTLIASLPGFLGNAQQLMTESFLETLKTAAQNNQIIDLSDQHTLTDIIKVGAANSGIVCNTEEPTSQVATILSEINTTIQQAAEKDNVNSEIALSNIIKLQILTQTEIIPSAVDALDTGNLASVVTRFTEEQLIEEVDEIIGGKLNSSTAVNDGDELTNKIIIPEPEPEPTLPTTDTTKPTLTGSTPTDDATAITVDSNVILTFNETIKAGTGNIIISNGSDTRTIDITDGTQVSFSGSSVTIDSATNLNPNTTYHVKLASGVITDTTGNAYAGITDATTLNFSTPNTTPADMSAPTLSSSTPADDATAVAVNSDIVLTFNETIKAGTGNIVISDGTDTRTIDITDGTQVSFSSNSVTINPSADLNNSTYNIQLASGVITDAVGNAYTGINDTTTINFNTLIAPIELSAIEQSDNDSGFVINGVGPNDNSGRSVSGGGDVNGDGFDDLIVGAKNDDPNGSASGASFVVFGKTNESTVELSAIENGSGGFVINGVSADDQSGISVSNAGDVNGDGLADMIVGARFDDPNGTKSGASFVVFGKTNGSTVELSDVESGNGGFVINGVSANDQSGISVGNAGDIKVMDWLI